MSEPIIDLTESSPPPVEQARTPSAKALLQSAIDTAQPARLRETLQAICNSSADAAHIASILLLVPENQVKKSNHRKARSDEGSNEEEDDSEETSDENSDESEDEDEAKNGTEYTEAASTNLKRLRPKYAICENCSEEFDVTDNGKKACSYHDGRLLLTGVVGGLWQVKINKLTISQESLSQTMKCSLTTTKTVMGGLTLPK
jgi:hypothetical protein